MVKYKGSGVVWDAERNRPLCRFDRGEYTATDPRTQTILDNLGYKGEDDEVYDIEIIEEEVMEESEEEIKDINDMGVRELKAYCKDNGYKGYTNLDKEPLLKFIKDKEGAL